MKLRILATAVVLAAVVSAPATAMISKQELNNVLNSAISSGSLSSVVNGDTVILYGVVDGAFEANTAKQAALDIEGVNNVINRVTISR